MIDFEAINRRRLRADRLADATRPLRVAWPYAAALAIGVALGLALAPAILKAAVEASMPPPCCGAERAATEGGAKSALLAAWHDWCRMAGLREIDG